jgi:hypothetical protein
MVKESNLTKIAAQKAVPIKNKSANILIKRFTRRGAVNKKSIGEDDVFIYVILS